jgi:hypothetical protein
MTDIVKQLHSIAATVAPYVSLLQTLESATGIGGPPAVIGIAIIKAGVEALAKDGTLSAATAAQIAADMHALRAGVSAAEAADDAAADAIVAARRTHPA